MATPFQAFVGTYVSGAGIAQSGFWTFSFANTAGFEGYVPIIITCPGTTSVSAGAEVTMYRSTDGGASWENQGTLAYAFPRHTSASQILIQDIYVSTGQFYVSVQVGGGVATTYSANAGTAWILTAYA